MTDWFLDTFGVQIDAAQARLAELEAEALVCSTSI